MINPYSAAKEGALSAHDLNGFSPKVLAWFALHGRKQLPWQHPRDPYRVWVSEIMLQQTQVATVIDYFNRFMTTFPDLKSLAEANADQVMHHWSGLGYYARARNLHQTAKNVMAHHQGRLPDDLEMLQSLPGIGRSTAGAIRSLAFGKFATILDGNVKRVVARCFAIPGWPGESAVSKQLWQLSEALTPQTNTADYNQAMMDLGAMVCLKSKPRCHVCPLVQNCRACKEGNIASYPGSKPKKEKPVRSIRLLILRDDQEHILLQQRPPSGIWGGLWSLPECPSDQQVEAWCAHNFGIRVKPLYQLASRRHSFTHFHLDITPVLLRVEKTRKAIMDDDSMVWYNLSKPEDLGLAAPVSRILQEIAPLENTIGEAK